MSSMGRLWLCLAIALGTCACQAKKPVPPSADRPAQSVSAETTPQPPPPPLADPVPFWEYGRAQRDVDAATSGQSGLLILDLGEAWSPYLFAPGLDVKGEQSASPYRPTYLALARGEFPDDLHGARAREDKYLELYGILPTLQLVRERMRATSKLACAQGLDLSALRNYTGTTIYSGPASAKKTAATYAAAEARVRALLDLQQVAVPELLDLAAIPTKSDLAMLGRFQEMTPDFLAIDALQQRLRCEGYLAGKGKLLRGAMDWATHTALAEFERRHRVFSWGFIEKDSLVPLRMAPLEAERETLLRVLSERALQGAGVIEDGSVSRLANGAERTFTGIDGAQHPIPNLAAEMRERLIEAFGLQTAESALAWLETLGELPAGEHHFVALTNVTKPEYYAAEMELTLDYDRGDVWYEFPYDDKGKEIPQPVSLRPNVTVSTLYAGQKIPLARYGTTIGGWRTELVNGAAMYRYKNSPVGPRAWEEIVAAPVWLPPDGTEPEGLLIPNAQRKLPTDPEYLVNYHETGPSYASAYGLVAAYHRAYARRADGTVVLGRDEGIRTHGSVDYMSIMRRHSHGCHRLHNHIALRLMSFVLAHRPHERLGSEFVGFRKQLVLDDKSYMMDIKNGGYVFKLKTPLLVNVEEGRVRGQVKAPIEIALPKFNPDVGAYLMPDGSKVKIRGAQIIQLTPPVAPLPVADAARTAPTLSSTVHPAMPERERIAPRPAAH